MRFAGAVIGQPAGQPARSLPAVIRQIASSSKFLIGILVLATVLRLLSAAYQGNAVISLPGIHDQISYDALARRVLGGYGFSFAHDHWPATRGGEPTAHWSYLYTLYLSAVYSLAGAKPVVARLIQATAAGILHTWLVWRIGRRVFGPAVGMVAAGLTALYIYFVYYAGALVTETFYIVAILWTFDCSFRLIISGAYSDTATRSCCAKWYTWLELGFAVAIAVLLRQAFLLFVPFLFLWLWWNHPRQHPEAVQDDRPLRRLSMISGLGLVVTVIVLMILPWTLRNYRAFGTFVPLNTNAGYAFFWGNHPIYGTEFVGILPADGPSYYELIPDKLLPLNEAQLDRALLKAGIKFVTDDPVRYVWLSFSRTREYFKFWPSSQSSHISNISRVASFGILLPFMLYGLWVGARLTQRPTGAHQRSTIALLLLFVMTYTAIHLMTWALIRYRLPVDAVLVIFAGLGLVDLIHPRRVFSTLAATEYPDGTQHTRAHHNYL